MPKIGRNDPCPCGSGKKYKKCCLEKDQAFELEMLEAAAAAAVEPDDYAGPYEDDYDELVEASNAVVDLVNTGRLDEAEQAANELLERFPDVYDGYARLGLVHEIRGNNQEAIACYRKVIDFGRQHPDIFDDAFEADYQWLIDRLEDSAPAP